MKKSLAAGVTLIELVIVLGFLAFLVIFLISTLNPAAQLKKAQDQERKVLAADLLSAVERYQSVNTKNPAEIASFAQSDQCEAIVKDGLVVNADVLANEASAWFLQKIKKAAVKLYLGISQNSRVRVCFSVTSPANLAKSLKEGCRNETGYYLCLPE